MSNVFSRRTHWAWWLLAVAMLLAWPYWPHDPAPYPVPRVATSPAAAHSPPAIKASSPAPEQSLPSARLPAFLPAEALHTITLIWSGGPFPNRQDGSVFGNREAHLPRKPHGWYHEYTVETPGLSHRGTRRIITGGSPPQVWYYTRDHYDSFRVFDPGTASGASQ